MVTIMKLRILLTLFLIGTAKAQLSSNFYEKSCPRALHTIRNAVHEAISAERNMGASLLRLHFHDCFVNGCDASVLLNDTSTFTGEQTASANAGSLRGFTVIDDIKSRVESVCPGVVSCADIIAVAARDSVALLGGPTWRVQLGRRDSTTANLSTANTDIPSPILDLSGLLSSFSKKGLTAKELVALSGAHTIGRARCVVIRNRIYNESNINASFAKSVKSNCPSNGGDNNLTALDVTTPDKFDNGYFKALVNNEGLIHSDQQLFNGGSTDSQVTSYSEDPFSFYRDFANAMIKMGNLTPLTGTDGEIRTNCWKTN